MSLYVSNIKNDRAQSQNALRSLQADVVTKKALQCVYRSAVIAKILCAANVWWDFTVAADRHQIDGLFWRSKQSGLCKPE